MKAAAWDAGGEHYTTKQGAVWCRVQGHGSGTTTFLHGYPTSSLDWTPLVERLPQTRARLFPDLLGFGLSARPRNVTYGSQIDALVELWQQCGIERTVLVAHDYSVSLVQEILSRISRGRWRGPVIQAAILLNGGLTYSANKPLLIQRLLRLPVAGPAVAQLASRRTFESAIKRITKQPHDLAQQWERIQSGGKSSTAWLASYHGERQRHEARWLAALAHAPVPIRMVWGMADPIAADQLAIVRRNAPSVATQPLADAGHYPHWDAPGDVAAAVLRLENAVGDRDPPLWPQPRVTSVEAGQ